MKKLTFICFLLFFKVSLAQNIILDTHSDNQELYKGIPNRVKILVEGHKNDEILIKTNNDQTLELNEFGFTTIQSDTSDSISLYFFLKRNLKDTIATKKYKLNNAPPPIIRVGGQNGGKIKLSNFTNELVIRAEYYSILPVVNMSFGVEVEKYQVTIFRKNKLIFSSHQNSSLLVYPEIKNVFKDLKVGDRVVFSGIKVKSGQKIHDCQPIEFEMIE